MSKQPDQIILDPGQGGMSIGPDALESGDIIVSTATGRMSDIIRGVTGSAVSHAGLYVADGLIVEALADGVILTTLERALADDRYAVVLRHPELSEQQRMRIRDFAGHQVGQRYDVRAIAMHGLYRLAGPACDRLGGAQRIACNQARWQVAFGNQNADRWYCSELIFAAYEAAGVPLGTRPAHSRAPQDLLELDPPLEYVGHLKAELTSSQALAHFDPLTQQQSLQNITHAGRYRLAYDRLTTYGVIEPQPGRDTRVFRGTPELQAALDTWATAIPTVMDPPPTYILTGGMTVNKPGQHGEGNAVDIDGFWWSDDDTFLATQAPEDWPRYLRYEATLRKAFGTVLNHDYNAAHRDHWHCDLGASTNWRGVSSQARFAQRALKEIWGENLEVDGRWGSISRAALERAGYDFSADNGWQHFLDDIIHQQSGSTLAVFPMAPYAASGGQPSMARQWAAAIGGLDSRAQSMPAFPRTANAPAAIKAAEMTIGLLAGADNNIDISWQVPQSSGRYHPRHDGWNEQTRGHHDSRPYSRYEADTWATMRSIIGTQIWSKHRISFDYNGIYIANVSVSPPREMDDRLGWGLRVEGQITPHQRVFRKGGLDKMARVDVDLYWYFSVSILGIWKTVTVCHKTLHLYANGDVYVRTFWDAEERRVLQRMVREANNPPPAAAQGIRQVPPVQRSIVETSTQLEQELLPEHIELTPADTEGRFVTLNGEGPEPVPTDGGPALVASLSSGPTLGGLPLLPAQRASRPASHGNLALQPRQHRAPPSPVPWRENATEARGRILTLAPSPEQVQLLEEESHHAHAGEFPVSLPRPGSGEDRFTLEIPQGMRFAYLDIEYLDRSPLASVEVVRQPRRGADGRQNIQLAWSHPPYGKVHYRVRAYATADGQLARPVRVQEDAPGAADRMKLLIEQDVPVEVLVKGNRARLLYEAIRRVEQEQPQSRASVEPITIVAGLAIVVVIAAVVMLGFMMLYAVLTQAMNKGYDVQDTRYQAATGEGATRQEHELLFNLTQPR